MSFQAYLDAIETKTGKTPRELVTEANGRGFGPDSKAGADPRLARRVLRVGARPRHGPGPRHHQGSHDLRQARRHSGDPRRRHDGTVAGRSLDPAVVTRHELAAPVPSQVVWRRGVPATTVPAVGPSWRRAHPQA